MDKYNAKRRLQVYQQLIEHNISTCHDLVDEQFDLMQKLATPKKYEHWLVQWRDLLRQL